MLHSTKHKPTSSRAALSRSKVHPWATRPFITKRKTETAVSRPMPTVILEPTTPPATSERLLLAELHSPDRRRRRQAVYQLGKAGVETAVPYLIDLIHNDPERDIRVMSYRAIRQIDQAQRKGE